MSRLPNAVGLGGLINNYVADVGVTLVFGLGYYLFKSLKKKDESCWSDPKENLKNLKGKLEGALERWQYAKTIEEYHELIKTNYEGIDDPFSIINLMNRKGIMPTIETYNALLLNCLLTNNNESAELLKEEMLDPTGPVTPNVYTLNVLIKGLGLKYKELLKNLEGENYQQEKLKLFSLFDQELMQLIESLENMNVYMDLVTQNTIMESLVEQERLNEAWNQYINMKKFFSPDMFTYTTLLKGIQQTSQLNEEWLTKAFQILHEAKSNFEIDETFFNSLLEACVKFNRIDKAEELFTEMKEKKGITSIHTFITMIKGYGKALNIDKAYEMFKCIATIGSPTTFSYEAILNACIRCKDINLAESLIEEMTKNKIEKNIHIYSIMINGYRKTRNFAKAIELYDYLITKIKENHESVSSVQLNTNFFNSTLDCCVDSFKYDKMNEIFLFMKEKTAEEKEFPQLDLVTYSIVLKGYAKSNSVVKVNEVYSYLRTRKDCKLDEVLYNTVMDCYARHSDEQNVLKVYSDMKANQVNLSVVTFGVLIKLYCNLGNCNKAFELFDECIKSDNKPSVVIYQMLIKLQVKSNYIDRAITMFRNMKINSIKADHIIYELIIKSCIEQGRPKEAAEFTLMAMKESVKLEKFIFQNLSQVLIDSDVVKMSEKIDLISQIIEASEKVNNFDKSVKETFVSFINSNNKKPISSGIYNYSNESSIYSTQPNTFYNNQSNYSEEKSLYEEVGGNLNNYNKRNYNQGNYNYNVKTKRNNHHNFSNNYNRYEEKSIYS